MIWLDGLDLPLYQAFPVNFAELYKENRYPSEYVSLNAISFYPRTDLAARLSSGDGDLRFGWDEVQKILDSKEGTHAVYYYGVGLGGARKPLSLTMGGQAERVDAGTRSIPIRESCSFVYHCFEGKGRSELTRANGETEVVEWAKGDTFAVPAWTERVHCADQNGRSYLFAVNDEPLLKNLGMYRREGEPV